MNNTPHVKANQLMQSIAPRGYVSDISGEIFKEPVFDDRFMSGLNNNPSIAKSILTNREPLMSVEYFNRKAMLQGQFSENQVKARQDHLATLAKQRLPRFLVPDTTEFPFDPEANYLGLKLPYPKCLFILNPGNDMLLVYGEQVGDDYIKLLVELPEMTDAVGEFHFEWREGLLIKRRFVSHPPSEQLCDAVFSIPVILDGLSKNYVVAEGDAPPKNREIPEARKGCTVRVVKLHPNAESIRKAWQGGTHASPREHTRRGHWRRGRDGKPIWINQLVVNKGKTEGIVDKEYYIRLKENIAKKLPLL